MKKIIYSVITLLILTGCSTKKDINISKVQQMPSFETVEFQTPTPQYDNNSGIFSSEALFAFDSYTLKPEGKKEIKEFLNSMSNYDYNYIEVYGYADNIGNAKYNTILSKQRADAVKKYIISLGFSQKAVYSAGRGSQKPISICNKDLNWDDLVKCEKPNRRVEIELYTVLNN